MIETIISVMASTGSQPPITPQGNAPDSGATALLLSIGIVALGAIARFVKNKRG